MTLLYTSFQVKGHGRGQREVVPTINLMIPKELEIEQGIYAAWIYLRLDANREFVRYKSAMHYGSRPTYGETDKSIEFYILDREPQDELYYDRSKILFSVVKKIHNIYTFASSEALKKQIEIDVRDVQAILSSSHS